MSTQETKAAVSRSVAEQRIEWIKRDIETEEFLIARAKVRIEALKIDLAKWRERKGEQ